MIFKDLIILVINIMTTKSKIDNLDIKLIALEEAMSYPSLKDRNFNDSCLIQVDSFTYDDISEQITKNEKLTNLEGAKMNLILEILRLLDDYKIKYNIELHNTIGFYFRGLPILIVKVTGGQSINQDRMVYISVKVYKDELAQGLTDKKLSNMLAGTIGGLLLIGGAIIGYKLVQNQST